VSKGSRINVDFAFSGAGDGNRTHVRSLERWTRQLEAKAQLPERLSTLPRAAQNRPFTR
jgi:hypothetical protein